MSALLSLAYINITIENLDVDFIGEMIEKMQAAIDKSEKMTQLATATLNELINKMYPDEGTTNGATEGTTDETTKEN